MGPGGLSPYQILFGRDRLTRGIPYVPERVCEESQEFFKRMETLDHQIAQNLELKHQESTTQHNQDHPSREDYTPGSLVWVLKPPDLASQSKLEAKWRGPFVVKTRTGQGSYMLSDRSIATFSAYVDQITLTFLRLYHDENYYDIIVNIIAKKWRNIFTLLQKKMEKYIYIIALF